MDSDSLPVKWIAYRHRVSPEDAAESFSYTCSDFELEFQNGLATFHFRERPYSQAAGERMVTEFLTSFEGDLLLQGAPGRREFRLDSGEYVEGGGFRSYFGTLTVIGSPDRRPHWRYHQFIDDDLVSALIERYQDYRRGREKLLVMAYLCLSALETAFGARRRALGKELGFKEETLPQLGKIVSCFGTYRTARKISKKDHTLQDLAPTQVEWVEWVVRELILRAGMVRSGKAVVDLPLI